MAQRSVKDLESFLESPGELRDFNDVMGEGQDGDLLINVGSFGEGGFPMTKKLLRLSPTQ